MESLLEAGTVLVPPALMFAVGAELERRHFAALSDRKALVLLTLVSQGVILPALGWALVRLLALPSPIAEGFLLLAACPASSIGNAFVLLAGADLALAVALSSLSLLLAPLTIPFLFGAYRCLPGTEISLAVPSAGLYLRLALILVLPLLAGMALRHRWPARAVLLTPALRVFVLLGIVYLVAVTIMVRPELLAAQWLPAAAFSALFVLLSLLCGLALLRLRGHSAAEGFAVGVSSASRNLTLALAVGVSVMNRPEYAVSATVFFLTEVPLLLGASVLFRKWASARGIAA